MGKKIINHWEIGESFAERQMNNFLKEVLGIILTEEISQTNLMYQECHHIFIGDKFLQIHFGISRKLQQDVETINIDIFKSELGWREFL